MALFNHWEALYYDQLRGAYTRTYGVAAYDV